MFVQFRLLSLLVLALATSCNKDEKKCDLVGEDPAIIDYCKSEENFSNTPFISSVTISRNHITQLDSIKIKFSFTDGDGDLKRHDLDFWNCDNFCVPTCFDTASFCIVSLTDTRHNCQTFYRLPLIENLNSPILGDIYLSHQNICCVYPNGSSCVPSTQFPVDTVTFIIRLKDEAGNVSNAIETPPIFIECN